MSNNKKKALGRGLGALLSNPETDITTSVRSTERAPVLGSVAMLKIEQIETNPFQPRTQFEEIALEELSESIRTHGIIQPVTVRKMGYDKYQLISGERRFRASQLADLKEIPAYVRIANDEQMLEMALVENIQREELDAVEIAISYQRLIEECKLTQEQLAEKVSKQRSTVTNYLRLLKLPVEIQMGIRDRKISMGHARTLINIDDKETQITIFEAIIEQELSVRAAEEMVRNLHKGEDGEENKSKVAKVKNVWKVPESDKQLMTLLKNKFDAPVEIKRKGEKGNISIPFNSTEEFQRIVNLLEK